jgi:WD40 repeat protein
LDGVGCGADVFYNHWEGQRQVRIAESATDLCIVSGSVATCGPQTRESGGGNFWISSSPKDARVGHVGNRTLKCIAHVQNPFIVGGLDDGRVIRFDPQDVRYNHDSFDLVGRTGSPIQSVAFSPAGMLVAAGTSNGQVHLWDIAKRAQWPDLDRNQNDVGDFAFTAEGHRLVVDYCKENTDDSNLSEELCPMGSLVLDTATGAELEWIECDSPDTGSTWDLRHDELVGTKGSSGMFNSWFGGNLPNGYWYPSSHDQLDFHPAAKLLALGAGEHVLLVKLEGDPNSH